MSQISINRGDLVKYASRVVLCLLVIVIPFLSAAAQSPTGAITGLVDDPTKAGVAGAKVTVTNTDTGVKTAVETNADGAYAISGLLPGPYRLEVEKRGFKSVVDAGLVLHVQDNVQINFHLALGSATESVSISAEAITPNTTDASVSTIVDRQFVENLPLNGRSFQSLLYLTPGISTNQNITGSTGTNNGGFVVNGQRGDANYWMVDGVSASAGSTVGATLGPGAAGSMPSSNVLGGTSSLVSVDALQEFRIVTSTYAPEFGRVLGGQISIQTRSGTNQFHGAAFDYFRNGALDATEWFANSQGVSKAIEKQHDFGGVVGGPIIRNKTFFFFSYEGFRLRLPETFIATVPDLAARQAAIPAMQPYLNAYPLPKPGVADIAPGLAPYSTSFSNPASADAYSIRIDHQLANNLNLFGRYNQAPSSATVRGATALTANTVEVTHQTARTVTLGATWTKSTIVNDARFNFTSDGGSARYFVDTYGGGTPLPIDSLFPSGFTLQNAWSAFIPSFGTQMNFNEGFTDPSNFQHQYNIVDTVATQRGKHALKFGADYRHLSPKFGFAQYVLVPIFASLSDMENGVTALTETGNSPALHYSLNNLSLFGQDTWHVTSRLNLTYGLRWDIDFSPGANPPLPSLTGFSLTDLSALTLAPVGTSPYGTHYRNFAPRIGGAYQLLTNQNWGLVVRGGFGVFYGLVNTEIENAGGGAYPQGGFALFFGANFPTSPQVAALPPIVPPSASNGQTLFGFDPNLNAPYALQWDVALEQSLGKAQSFTLSYIGASDRRLLSSESVSNPNPNYAAATLVANTGTSNYNAMQAQFRRALSSGLQALVSYTWSHSIDNGSYGAYANGSFADSTANRGSSDFDIRQIFSAALTYQVPGLKRNAISRAITDGWSTENIIQVHTAPPIDIKDGNFSALSQQNVSVLIRPDIVPGEPLYVYGPQYPGGKALNPAAFTDPPVDPTTGLPTRQGDLGRNQLRAFGLTEWDFAVHREFPIHESVRLQFSAELFNVLNHPNFGLFNNTFQSGNAFFGQATTMQNQLGGNPGWGVQSSLYASGGPRSTQLALKLIF
jgi:hypothetical protein